MKNLFKERFSLMAAVILFLPDVTVHAQDYAVRIAFMGNSITYGDGTSIPATQSYPAQVGDLLEGVFGDTCVIGNFAISSRTMLKNGDFPTWDDPEFDQALAFKPNIVVIALGTNDSKPQNWDAYGGEFYGDYMSMIDTFKRINPFTEFFVCYPPPAFEIVWGIRDSVIVNGVIPVVDQVLAETGAELIDFYNPLKDSVHLFPDFIHPNYDGAAAMARIVFDRFMETDVIRQAEKGVTFITSLESDRKYITSEDTMGILSWTTINATAVYLDGSEVDFNGSRQVDHLQGTTHTIVAEGAKHTDTAVYEFVLYTPLVEKITLSATETSFYTGDTVTVSAVYNDQHGYPLNDTVLDLQWSISYGKGTLFGPVDNAVYFTTTKTGTVVIAGSYMGTRGGITLKVSERGHTSAGKMTALPALEVFPNPFDDHITLRFNRAGTGECCLKVIDLLGKTCINRKIDMGEAGQHDLDTDQLPEGIYMYQLDTGQSMVTGKLVKSRAAIPLR
jgi:acyl-CoA thioesterase-1